MTTKKKSGAAAGAARHSVAINAFLGCNWAIDPTWLNNAWAVLQETGGTFDASESAEQQTSLRAIAGERPEGTRYTIIPENSRTAIIEIWGAIMPRANVMTEYSGGTSAELLVRDISAAADNDFLTDVLFVIHSPGGEVTGITEVVDAIKSLKAKKRATAYVKGTCASAALWIASTCHRIVANRAAQIGSLGVYSCYIDRSKAMEKAGYEEIEFKADQSPDKNLDPKTERGRSLYQVRMNDLCDVFIEDVAENMGLTVETVKENFGKGDVYGAKKAKSFGMIHQIASFEQAIAISAKTGGSDNYSDESEGPDAKTEKTLNSANNLSSDESADSDVSAPNANQVSDNNSIKNEESMSKKEENKPAAGENTNAAETAAAAQTGAENKPAENAGTGDAPAASAAAPAANADAPAASAVGNLVVGAGDVSVAQQLAAAQEQIKALQATNLKADLTAVASGFAGDKAAHLGTLTALTNAFGRESAQVTGYIEQQKALTAQIAEGALFGEKGKTGADASGQTALQQLNAKAAVIQTEEKMTKQKAFVAACERNPELYEAHKNDN